jgi:carboxyl-terminal processing protease
MRIVLGSLLTLALACGKESTWRDTGNLCQTPRTGTDPVTGVAYRDRQGSSTDEKRWLRSWIDDTYLWYREVPNEPPTDALAPLDYFNLLKTPALTSSQTPKDKYHFTEVTTDWEALSEGGVQGGYGFTLAAVSRTRPRLYYVAYTEPGSPAEAAKLARGAEILTVDGVDLINGTDLTTLNNGLFPPTVGETHTLTVLDRGASQSRDVQLVSASVASAPVQHAGLIPGTTVGYLLFNEHVQTAEKALADAISALAAQGATDLVLDLRYNGGGLLAVASELAYMIAGPARTGGKTFEELAFNDKYSKSDPITGETLAPTPFYSAALGFSVAGGAPLPHLDLARVFVLTGGGTCSASESVINSLRGVDVDVSLFGGTTCGKPYGFYPEDNCGTTWFSIQFKGVNAKGFGDYPDGFVPGSDLTPGCAADDDFTHELGDPAETRLAAALAYRKTGACPAAGPRRARSLNPGGDVTLFRPQPLENRILLGPR